MASFAEFKVGVQIEMTQNAALYRWTNAGRGAALNKNALQGECFHLYSDAWLEGSEWFARIDDRACIWLGKLNDHRAKVINAGSNFAEFKTGVCIEMTQSAALYRWTSARKGAALNKNALQGERLHLCSDAWSEGCEWFARIDNGDCVWLGKLTDHRAKVINAGSNFAEFKTGVRIKMTQNAALYRWTSAGKGPALNNNALKGECFHLQSDAWSEGCEWFARIDNGNCVWLGKLTEHRAHVIGAVLPSHMDAEDIHDLEYRPLVSFVDNPPRGCLKSCGHYIRECSRMMPDCIMLEESAQEVANITASKLESRVLSGKMEQAGVSKDMLMAIVMYTFDLCMLVLDYTKNQCWYHALNVKLRERDAEFVRICHGYLYYLMTGLARLPPYGMNIGEIVYRGIDEIGVDRALQEYTDGRRIHWSGFSSATCDVDVAKKFAGANGVVLRIRLLKTGSAARDIRELSALNNENEILLLPNFCTIVFQEADMDAALGVRVIDLKEEAKKKKDIF